MAKKLIDLASRHELFLDRPPANKTKYPQPTAINYSSLKEEMDFTSIS